MAISTSISAQSVWCKAGCLSAHCRRWESVKASLVCLWRKIMHIRPLAPSLNVMEYAFGRLEYIYHLWMIPRQTSHTKLYQYIVQGVPVHIHPSRLDLIAVAASHCSLTASPAAAAAAYPAAAPVTAPKPTAQRSLYNSSTIFCWTAARALTVHPPQNARVSAVWFEMEVEGATGYQPPSVTTLCDKNDKWLGPVCLQRVYSFHRNVWTKWCRVNYVELGRNWLIGVLNKRKAQVFASVRALYYHSVWRMKDWVRKHTMLTNTTGCLKKKWV